MSFRKRLCMVCGGEIDEFLPRTQKYCHNRKCKWKYFDRIRQQSRDFRENRRRTRENLNQQARKLRNSEAAKIGIKNPEDFFPAAVPVNTRRTVILAEERQRAFRDHIEHLVNQAALERCSSGQLPHNPVTKQKHDTRMQDTELQSIMSSACAVCRGSCCVNGRDDAYLRVGTFLHYMQQNPELQQQQVLEEYMSCLTRKIYEDSCVYHTEVGCALPHDMRSESCSSFVCEGLFEIREHVVNKKTNRFFIAAMEGTNVFNSAFIDGNQIRGLHMNFTD